MGLIVLEYQIGQDLDQGTPLATSDIHVAWVSEHGCVRITEYSLPQHSTNLIVAVYHRRITKERDNSVLALKL